MGLENETKLDRNLDTPSRTLGVFFAVVLILTAVVNIVSNVLVLVVLARNNRLRTCTNFFIANLSLVDLLAGIILVPAAASSLLAQERKISDEKVCAFYGFLNSLYGIASSLTVAVIALDRYHSILNCLQYETIVTQRRTALVLVWIWLQSTFVSLCPLVGLGKFSLIPRQSCFSHLQDKNGFIFFKTASCVVLPYAITVFCYTRIHVVARRHARTIVNIQIRDARNRRLKGGAINLSASKKTVMVYVVLGVYTICWLPYYTIPPLVTVYPEATIPVKFILAATVLSLLNSACNPIMYALITSQFRNGLKRVYRRIRRSIFSGDVRQLNPTGPRDRDSRSSWTFTRSSARRFFATSQEPGRPKLVMDLNPACAVIKEEESSFNTRAVEKPDAGINCPSPYPLTLQVPDEQWHKNRKITVKPLADGDVKKNGWIGD